MERWIAGAVAALCLIQPSPACCPAPRAGQAVVNSDQSVIILWDEANQTQHFIRRASFKSEGADFGFLIPSPSEPELSESGNEAFPYLATITAPEKIKRARPAAGGGCGCGAQQQTFSYVGAKATIPDAVRVLQEKEVAGFKASVLEADSTKVLAEWLKDNGYAFSPEVEAWAKPYIGGGWKITAFKVAKSGTGAAKVDASALRMTFKTEKPLFPYREPDSKLSAEKLAAQQRMLRIYFLANARFEGELTKDSLWTGKVAWANKLAPEQRKKTLEMLKLPETTGPSEMWLTEFEDNWPYRVAPADLYFAADKDQSTVKRPPIIEYVSRNNGDAAVLAVAVVFAVPFLGWLRRRS